jgi:hypothetical protein
MSEPREELAQARQLGRFQAERLDAALRAAEQSEREMIFARLLWDGIGADPAALAMSGGSGGEAGGSVAAGASEVWRLQQDIQRLAAYHQAVQRSRAWRVVQWLRRPFGRAW